MIPLFLAPKNKNLKVAQIKECDNLKVRLSEMGIFPGSVLSVSKTSERGPAIIDVKGTRVALGWGLFSKIYVDFLD